jgi:ABC-type multidrug transport system fused ATPase/permease subunit
MEIFRELLFHLRIYRRYIGRRIYIVFALATLGALTEGFGITLLLPLLRVSQTGASGGEDMGMAEQVLFDFLSSMGVAESMTGILAFIALAFLLKGGLKFVEGAYQGYLRAQLLRELKSQIFNAYNSMDYRYYIDRNTGHFINVINGQISGFLNSFSSYAGFLTKIITTVSYFAFAFVIAWRFALMALVFGLVLLFVFKYLNEYVRQLSRKTAQEMSQLNKLLVQSLQAFKYIVSTGQVGHLREGVMNSIRRLTGYQFRQSLAGSLTSAVKEPISVLFIVGVIAVQAMVFGDPIAPIFVAILLFHRGMQSVISIQSGWQNVMGASGSLEMVVDEFETVRNRQETSGTEPVPALSKGIEFHDVCFAYDEEDGDVLHDINITIPVNTTVALVGESGAGKSTLVDMMTLMLRPRTGEIRIDDVPGSEADLASWRSQIGYVSQETVVFDDTIANNISLWKGDYESDPEHRERVEQAARDAYAHHFIEDLPNGYQTVVGDRGVRLSGGQRQRLFVARELFKQPNLLLLDEATSALDTESERYIQQSIDDLQGEVTVVIIAHRLSTIKNVDYIYVLDDGHVIEQGTYDELRGHEESRFREMVEMQSL